MSQSDKRWLLPACMIVLGLAAVALIAFGVWEETSRARVAERGAALTAVSTNLDVDPGTPAGDTPAPGFALRDQNEQLTSLEQFRGKVVLMAFVDSHCTTICPLTTQSMVEALRLLGPAAADVQLLGINANPLATKVSDVADYTRVHEMQGRWRFLTGPLPQLKRVWRDYHVYVAAIHNDIDHQPAMVLIDTVGREHTVYLTRMSYEGVAQQAQILADDIARLLPGPPTAAQKMSLRYVEPVEPDATLKLTGLRTRRTVMLGTPHAHLYLFFASWLNEDSNLAARLGALDSYAAMARRRGWPSPVAVDELPTEASAASARQLLTRLAAGLRTPIVEDADGRLADGYQVEDLPWFALSTPSGKIVWSHDGWLSAAELSQQVDAAAAQK
jgi:cytochrome oxidase Cu insertion factor (SCO1/SenC/PrrC family)